ncbi:MAG: type II toxin-antitoxin system Phd/YefM family antitoxin [Schwartzia sp.]|nr:type II toxin-antitoxin system Phd/YefM family antitoxin [Schwartzia sp. (in: firmicutes)]
MPTISLRNAIQNSVPISNFNKGMAGKIFADVRSNGPKVVIKNNTPECVLMSPEEYISLLDELDDMRLLAMAKDRISHTSGKTITHEEIMKKYGISQEELDSMEDVEIE